MLFLKKFMRGEEAEYRGHMMHSEWIKDPVPLYLAADGPRALKLAGRVADGVITMPGSPSLMKWKLGHVEQGALEAGRDPATIDVWVRSILIVADSKKAAFREGSSFLPGSIQFGNYMRFRNIGYREEIDGMMKQLGP